MKENILCQGCGVFVQTEEPDKPGFIPQSTLKKHGVEAVLCKRCFRLKNYNETQEVDITDNDFLRMVSSINEAEGLVIHVIDLFDVSGSIIQSLPRIVGEKQVILVGNKVDLLPKSTNKEKLMKWLRSHVKEAGIKVTDVFLISSTKGYGIKELTNRIEATRKGSDVYIVGTTNVGKSTFINHVIKQSTEVDDVITTSYYPGTTLGFIEIPLDDQAYLIDTPGIVNKQQMAHYVSEKDLKLITPKNEVKPRGYQLNHGQTLFIGGLVRLDFIKGDKRSFICYFSNRMPIHRTKLENADQLYENHLGTLLLPPDKNTLKKLPPLKASTFRIENKRLDIVFPGLGWITVTGTVTVTAHSPKGVTPLIRNSLM